MPSPDVLRILTFSWLLFWAWRAMRMLGRGDQHAIYILLIVHFILNGLPLLLDVLFGVPLYTRRPGFNVATRDDQVLLYYCLYVSAIPIVWWLAGKAKIPAAGTGNPINDPVVTMSLRNLRPALYILPTIPLIAWLFAPSPNLYLTYGPFSTGVFPSLQVEQYNNFISVTTLVSVIAIVGLLASSDKLRVSTLVALMPWLLLAFWLNGKRYLVVIALLAIWYVFWQRGFAKGLKFYIVSFLVVAVALGFSYIYQDQVRNLSPGSVGLDAAYENLRIDFGRDTRIMMTLYAELHPYNMQILEFRGQSLLFDLTMYVPREFWVDKPYPYAQYFTSAMLLSSPRLWGWSMNTSWLEEAIANFGWFGLLLGPLVPAAICRIGDSRTNTFAYSLTVLVGSLLLAVHLPAFMPLFLAWVIVVIWPKNRQQRRFLPTDRRARLSMEPEGNDSSK